jgi:hypothetical protein
MKQQQKCAFQFGVFKFFMYILHDFTHLIGLINLLLNASYGRMIKMYLLISLHVYCYWIHSVYNISQK